MFVEPINDYVFLKKIGGDMNLGGIIVAEDSNAQVVRAVVVAVGPGKVLESGAIAPMQMKAGDEVFVNTYACAPTRLPIEEEGEFMLIPQKDIAAVLRSSEKEMTAGASSREVNSSFTIGD